jgi:hypothetical protein
MMWKNLSPGARSHLREPILRLTAAVALSLLLAITATAYTLVFKDGRRIDIPSEFTLTTTTLTYEISPGFNKTFSVALLDVPATERTNGESAGSFFRHREQTTAVAAQAPSEPAAKTPATRTLSNSDLAAVRQRRIESEKAYEKRRLELGLPTVAETRRRQAEESADFQERLRAKSKSDAQEESYWRGRARELRTEIASVDAGINYLHGRITELNESASANQPVITQVYPLWPYDRGGYGRGRNGRWGGVPQTRPPLGSDPYPNRYPNRPYGYPNGRYPNGGYPNGGYPNGGYPNGGYPNGGYPNGGYPNGGYPNGGYPNGGYPNGPYGYPNGSYGYPNVYGYPNGGYGYPTGPSGSGPFGNPDNSAEQADVKSRMDELVVRRAALLAQWQALEDEARDARIPQVWLLP